MRNGCSHPSAYVYAPPDKARQLLCADCGLVLGAATTDEPAPGERRLARIDRDGRLLGWRAEAETVDGAELARAVARGIVRFS